MIILSAGIQSPKLSSLFASLQIQQITVRELETLCKYAHLTAAQLIFYILFKTCLSKELQLLHGGQEAQGGTLHSMVIVKQEGKAEYRHFMNSDECFSRAYPHQCAVAE